MSDDVDILRGIFFFEVERAALRNGAEVVFELFFGHSDAVVGNFQRARLLIRCERDCKIACAESDAVVGETFKMELVQRIRCVADKLTKENLLVRIDGVYHQIKELLAFRLEFFHCHNEPP